MRFSRVVFEAACKAAANALKMERPADAALSSFFREHRKLGRHERATVAETVYGLMRRRRLLEYLIGAASVRSLVLTCWAVLLGANLRELDGIGGRVELDALAEAKRRASESLPLAVECDLPDWLIERLRQRFGERELRELAAALLQPAPLDLRVNVMKSSREAVLARLAADGIAAQPTPYSPFCLRVRGKPALDGHQLYTGGEIEIQDEGSQLLCCLTGARRGEMVVDFCAGAGGKALALGMLMRSTGRLYAFDVSEGRLRKLKPRLARSGLSNVHPRRIDGENDMRLSRLAGKIDRVLVDAPCTGLGTLRRNPDLKWRQSPHAVQEMAKMQHSILASAARLLKQGGRLVYATCSILDEENRQVVNAFLAGHTKFKLRPAGEVLREERIELETGEYLELWPHRHGTDGFFAAVLERVT